MEKYHCHQCDQDFNMPDKQEHEDWHFATDLNQQANNTTKFHDVATNLSQYPSGLPHTSTDGNVKNSFSSVKPQQKRPDSDHDRHAPRSPTKASTHRHYANIVDEAAQLRAKDEQDMQNALQTLQLRYRIYNGEIEPEHESEYPCGCAIHQYQRMKRNRRQVLQQWSDAVMYPGEKMYHDFQPRNTLFSGNPYLFRVTSPYGYGGTGWTRSSPQPKFHVKFIHDTIQLNNQLNHEAQAKVDDMEPKLNIWNDLTVDGAMAKLTNSMENSNLHSEKHKAHPLEKAIEGTAASNTPSVSRPNNTSRFSSFRKAIGLKSSSERLEARATKAVEEGLRLRKLILAEEYARWPDHETQRIVAGYQSKVGMENKIAHLRKHQPLQYLHLLRAGYFEPIPVAWADQASNILTFSIEAASGWRGITPSWRGFEDTAEERLYWVLNHREGSVGMRMKPDFVSEMNMARDRMSKAVEPPPDYYSADDTCHLQHMSKGYSKQVMPPPLRAGDRPEVPTDDTMILLDISGSMDFDPLRPDYDQYLITGFSKSTQPKNKYVAKAIIRRFIDAMANHDHEFNGYDLVTFSSHARFVGTISHTNLEVMWSKITVGGGTRVMTGWQRVKQRHFEKHRESATYHPVYGWQAGPETPMLRLLLLLDGEATDMDEFELELLGLSWAHVTIFLIGVDECPHHHRHANELQRISDVNHHVSFVDAQGNTPERFVTHELLKRHLGYEMPMAEFQQLEELPPYVE